MKKIYFIFVLLAFGLFVRAQQYFPVRDRQEVTSLDGTWQFKLDGAKEWRNIQVPGNWERQGVKVPEYGRDLREINATYRRTFLYDKYWDGRDVILRLDGVQNGFTVFVNGHEVGSGHSAHTMHQYNITPYLKTSANSMEENSGASGGNAGSQALNDLTIKVSSHSDYWLFDVCDAWSYTGIQHSVELFSVPREASIADVIFTSKVNQDNSADLCITTKTNGADGTKVTASLLDERYNHVLDLHGSVQDGNAVLSSHLAAPRLWTAETPNLYSLVVTLYNNEGKKLQMVEDRVGIREVRADSCNVILNNHPIFLRGATLSENDAIEGSAMSPETFRKILLQMKAANINFIRTAHYPLNPAFNRMCDELGFYVCEEIPFASRGDAYLKTNSPEVIQELKDRAKATIDRDRNRPSIILWSHGNENKIYSCQDSCLKFTKEYDQTRLRGVPQAKGSFLTFIKHPSEYVDVICGHYANDAVLAQACELSSKPLINTEYAHSLGTATGELEHKYEIFRREPKIAGGSIWSYEDQSVLTYNFNQQNQPLKGVRIDSLRYIDCYGLNPVPEGATEIGKEGTDGIVYGNLYPSEDYFEVAQVYSPVKISTSLTGGTNAVSASGGTNAPSVSDGTNAPSVSDGKIIATIQNEHDFLSLNGFQLQWQLLKYKGIENKGSLWLSAEAGSSESVALPCSTVAQGSILSMNILRPDGSLCYQKNVLLDTLTDYAQALKEEPVTKSKSRGVDVLKEILKNGFSLRVGRPITVGLDYRRKDLWPEYMIAPGEVAAKKQKDGYTISCRWTNPTKQVSFFTGKFDIKVLRNGAMDVSYTITPSDSVSGKVMDFGVTMSLPKEFTDVAWFGEGPFSHSADKRAYNNPGVWQLNKNDLRFWGNRGEARLLTAYSDKDAVSVASDTRNLFLENVSGCIYITDNLYVCDYGTKFSGPHAKSAKVIGNAKGHFIIKQNASALNSLVFGNFSPANPENPFLDSYGK